uniref:Uncharacterized protein n=1 Tax=Onchocerca volvulus TaxID=6282 RepID=A0A8R1Y346_ONCVO
MHRRTPYNILARTKKKLCEGRTLPDKIDIRLENLGQNIYWPKTSTTTPTRPPLQRSLQMVDLTASHVQASALSVQGCVTISLNDGQTCTSIPLFESGKLKRQFTRYSYK